MHLPLGDAGKRFTACAAYLLGLIIFYDWVIMVVMFSLLLDVHGLTQLLSSFTYY